MRTRPAMHPMTIAAIYAGSRLELLSSFEYGVAENAEGEPLARAEFGVPSLDDCKGWTMGR